MHLPHGTSLVQELVLRFDNDGVPSSASVDLKTCHYVKELKIVHFSGKRTSSESLGFWPSEFIKITLQMLVQPITDNGNQYTKLHKKIPLPR